MNSFVTKHLDFKKNHSNVKRNGTGCKNDQCGIITHNRCPFWFATQKCGGRPYLFAIIVANVKIFLDIAEVSDLGPFMHTRHFCTQYFNIAIKKILRILTKGFNLSTKVTSKQDAMLRF